MNVFETKLLSLFINKMESKALLHKTLGKGGHIYTLCKHFVVYGVTLVYYSYTLTQCIAIFKFIVKQLERMLTISPKCLFPSGWRPVIFRRKSLIAAESNKIIWENMAADISLHVYYVNFCFYRISPWINWS